jgi:hypothetical protein
MDHLAYYDIIARDNLCITLLSYVRHRSDMWFNASMRTKSGNRARRIK